MDWRRLWWTWEIYSAPILALESYILLRFLFFGTGLIIYLLLWIFMPKEPNSTGS